MLKIQFLDNNKGFLDIEEGQTVLFNFGSKDARDISKTRGVFSKEIKAPCTKNNDQLLGEYFDVNIQASTFNVNEKQKVDVSQNGVSLNREFYLQLKNVVYQNDKPRYYILEIRDNVADFFNTINNLELTDLDFSDGDHVNTADNVAATFPHTSYTDGLYKYHLTSNSDNEYQLNQFKPAIFAYHYLDRIFSNAGFQWEWDDFDDITTQFDKQIIPACKSNATVTDATAQVEATDSGFSMTQNYFTFNTNQSTIYDTEEFDPNNLYNPITGEYEPNYNYQSGQSLAIRFSGNAQFQLDNTTGGSVSAEWPVGSTQIVVQSYLRFTVFKNGVGVGSVNAANSVVFDNQTINIPTGILADVNYDVGLTISNVYDTDVITFGIEATQQGADANFNPVPSQLPEWSGNELDHNWVISDAKVEIGPSANNTPFFGELIRLNDFVPNKVKQSEFIKSIVMMNNLWIDPEESVGNKIVLKKRDAYLDAGEVKDYSRKIDLNQEYKLDFVPDLVSKRSELTYKQDKDALNESYEEALDQIYGEVEYVFDSEHVRETETKTLVFSPTPLHDTNFSAYVPAINGTKPDMNIRILIAGEELPCDEWMLFESPAYQLTFNTYPYVGHFDNPINPTYDINFSSCQYYFYNGLQTLTPNNLFNLNWRRQHNQINDGRLLTAYFALDELDILQHKLNDKWYVKNRYWNVQKIIDYDTNNKRLTKVELISADEGISLPVYSQGQGVIGLGSINSVPVNDHISNVTNTTNNFQGVGDILVKGKNNQIEAGVTHALVAGKGLVVKHNGLTTEALNLPNDVRFDDTGMVVNDFDVKLSNSSAEWKVLLEGTTTPFLYVDGIGRVIIGASGSRIGFFGSSPIPQPSSGGTSAAFIQNSGTTVNENSTFGGYTIGELVTILQNYGLIN